MKEAFNKARTSTKNFVSRHRTKIGVIVGVALASATMAGAKAYQGRKAQAAPAAM